MTEVWKNMPTGEYTLWRKGEEQKATHIGEGLFCPNNDLEQTYEIGYLFSQGWWVTGLFGARPMSVVFGYEENAYKKWIKGRVPHTVDTYAVHIGPEVSSFRYRFVRFALWLLRRCGVVVITGRGRREE